MEKLMERKHLPSDKTHLKGSLLQASWKKNITQSVIRVPNASLISAEEIKSYLAAFDIDVLTFDTPTHDPCLHDLTVKSSTLEWSE